MRSIERLIRRTLVGAIALGLGISACKETVTEPIAVAAVVVNGGGGSLRLGQSVQLSTTLKSTEGWTLPNVGVSWTSSDAAKANISPSGQVTAVSRGPVTLTASAGGVNGTAAVTVIGVQSISLAPETLSVIVTQTRTMTATTVLDPGVTVTPIWRSLDTTIARVDTAGRVTARTTTGFVRVEVTAEDKKDTAVVRVVPVPVVSVVVSPDTATRTVGQTLQLTAAPKDSIGGTLAGRVTTWTSSDTARASVTSAGLVTVKAAGTATITATVEGKTGSAALTLKVPVADVTVSQTSCTGSGSLSGGTGRLYTSETCEYGALVRDAAGNSLIDRTVTWTSSDTTVAKIDGIPFAHPTTKVSTVKLRPRKAGSVTLTAAVEGKSSSASLTVLAPVASVTITPATATLTIGATQQLTATLKDSAGGILTGRTVTWSSSDTGKATVSSTGLVTARSAGTVKITASSEGKVANIDVVVVPIATSGKSEWTLASGGNGSVYQILVGNFTWRQADSIARSQRHNDIVGHLATTTTEAEFNFVTALAMETISSTSIVFLGGYQDKSLSTYSEPSGGWRWVTNETWSFTKWMSGEPNNSCCSPAQTEEYLSLYLRLPENLNSWNDVPDDVSQFGKTTALVVEFSSSPVSSNELVAHYPLDGESRDWSGNGLHATAVNVLPIVDRFGNLNGAMRFNGSTSRIISDSAFFDQSWSNYTVSAWVKPEFGLQRRPFPSAGYTIWGLYPHNSLGLSYLHPNCSTASDVCVFKGNGATWTYFAGEPLPVTNLAGGWNNLTLTVEGTTLRFYLNGALVWSKTASSVPAKKFHQLIIGSIFPNADGEVFKGDIDDLRVWRRTLLPSEIAILGNVQVAALHSGGDYSCSHMTDGKLKCWGSNWVSRINGFAPDSALNIFRGTVWENEAWNSISTGNEHACAIRQGGEAYCWGRTRFGQLGTGDEEATAEFRFTPTPVAGGLKWLEIRAGIYQTCGISSPSRALYCWGSKGLTSAAEGPVAGGGSLTPTLVDSTIPHKNLSLAGAAVCTMHNVSKSWYCMGRIGNESFSSPQLVSINGTPADQAVVVGASSVCSIAKDGNGYCFGLHFSGALRSPVGPLAGVSGWKAFENGLSAHFCGTDASNNGYCWGSNFSGQIGDGSTINRPSPTKVSGTWLQLRPAMGAQGGNTGDHTCGLSINGSVYCWGFGQGKQLGDGSATSIVLRPDKKVKNLP